jgi:predicted nucleotidyltransferase
MSITEIKKEVSLLGDEDLTHLAAWFHHLARRKDPVYLKFLFGSAVDAMQVHEESDIDLCIVQKTSLRFYDRLAKWIARIQPKIGLDLVVYTPEEFAEMSQSNHFVRSEIAEKGREIYHAA